MFDNQLVVFLLNFCLSAPFDNFVPISRGDILLRAVAFCNGTASFFCIPRIKVAIQSRSIDAILIPNGLPPPIAFGTVLI